MAQPPLNDHDVVLFRASSDAQPSGVQRLGGTADGVSMAELVANPAWKTWVTPELPPLQTALVARPEF